MINTGQKLALAGLLHDIGKFYQRADADLFKDGKKNPANDIAEVSFNMAQTICPANEQGRFGYHHVVWTSQFFENISIRKKLEEVPGLKESIFGGNEDSLVNLACNHHMPDTLLQHFVQMADWWSAGIDRTQPSTYEVDSKADDKINWGKSRYKKVPLYSVFNTINNGKSYAAFGLHAIDTTKEEHIFPRQVNAQADGISQEDYRALWDKFVEEFEHLPSNSFDGFFNSLLFLLKKYTWCIPSNTMDMANVSLFDHLKTSAAIAQCMYLYYEGAKESFVTGAKKNIIKLKEDKFPLMLVGGDLSGIQKFIYNIASSKAAKSLKGRSFYVQLLADSILHQVLKHTDIAVNQAHIIYASGGKFYLLLPHLDKVKEALSAISSKLQEELWEEHQGKVSFQLAQIPFAYRSVKKDNKQWESVMEIVENNIVKKTDLGGLWKAMADQLTQQKNKPFYHVLLNDYDRFFDEKHEKLQSNDKGRHCAVTGKELKENEGESIENGVIVDEAVANQTHLGTALKDIDYLVTFDHPGDSSTYLNNRSHAHIKVAGVYHYLFDKRELTKDDAEFRNISSADVSGVYRINDTDFIIPLKGKSIHYGFKFYGGNEQAYYRDKAGEVVIKQDGNFKKKHEKTFEELTKFDTNNPDQETYLGVLRMDVDNLGQIFAFGIPEKAKSFSAYATLSFQLDLFFSGYLNTLRNSGEYRDWININYSGGDDVFAIGRWDKLILFAADIRNAFGRFIGREDLGISAGIAIVNNKFPIARAAEMAGDAEKAAKSFKDEAGHIKDALCFLGESFSWGEYEEVKRFKDELVTQILKYDLPKSILHRLMHYGAAHKRNKILAQKTPEKFDLSYKWHIAYSLKRLIERNKSKENIEFITRLQKDLFTAKSRAVELKYIAARWAELELKISK
ncbi:MAG: type III-A CRISPR-associated protein Cas10/Csm1 [Bacteroidales bacterium]|nr:type III-A CRISPR-associated protein Cas10/Csm1 [Bacteroidales bacterium]